MRKHAVLLCQPSASGACAEPIANLRASGGWERLARISIVDCTDQRTVSRMQALAVLHIHWALFVPSLLKTGCAASKALFWHRKPGTSTPSFQETVSGTDKSSTDRVEQPSSQFQICTFAARAYETKWRQHRRCRSTQVFRRRPLLVTAQPLTALIQYTHATLHGLINVERQENLCPPLTLSKPHLTVIVRHLLQEDRAEAPEVQRLTPTVYNHLKILRSGRQIGEF